MPSAFISSTGLDLADYRDAAVEVCNRLGIVPVAMELFEAMGVGATAGSVAKLEGADVYVGIFAHRYGYIEDGYDRSVTEIEFDRAGEAGLERLCFVLDPDYPWPPSAVEHEAQALLARFRAKLDRTVIHSTFTTLDNFKLLLSQALHKWQERRAEPGAIELILDLLATRRAFFKGDERALKQVWDMLGYCDAGRAVAVSRSLGEVAGAIEQELGGMRSGLHPQLKQALSSLIVACKDYAESYGPREGEAVPALPHIGWGQRLEDFNLAADHFGFPSADSIEVYAAFLGYLARSFRDLIAVRQCARAVLDAIASLEPATSARCRQIGELIAEGEQYLATHAAALDAAAGIVAKIQAADSGFAARKGAAAQCAAAESDPLVASLLAPISTLRHAEAWSRRDTSNTLVHAECTGDRNLRVAFADGLSVDLAVSDEYWTIYVGQAMDAARFRSLRLEAGSNCVAWDQGLFMTGEELRRVAEAGGDKETGITVRRPRS